MPYFSPLTRTIRFDFDKPHPHGVARLVVTYKPEMGIHNGRIWIGLRWTINFIDNNMAEIAGQLSETRGFFEKESEESDILSLRDFAYNSFLNVELYFDENKTISYKNIRLSQPPYDKIAEKIYALL